ncbi:hypothetical protein DL766_002846 [Monosporascus sp. MC13-8B]|uniref:2EXR domain-containing protein n=1 Tax=Monosporascus cannonballus TaxID=155416 RepID=A0ABY0GYS1_9PEZI|nr:hypothetical protein DL762_009093 [Monosporascus cannonballus]RYP00891.1 hypothetical protein DL763_000521 [Monosporascus cannonballus]RYP34733.1 hypothetical protein DL766_002846 [Monosporascus sp. MC13-8B]
MDDRGLLHVILRREKRILDAVDRLNVDQRHLQIAIEHLLDQNTQLLSQQRLLHRENATLRDEVAAIRRAAETVPRFTCFMKLPPEIRHKIWDLAIPRRFVRLGPREPKDEGPGEDGLDSESKHRPPAVSHVCREARAIATRNAGFRAVQYRVFAHSFPTVMGIPFEREWTWFDSARDMLIIPTWMAETDADIQHLTKAVQHVLVDEPHRYLGLFVDTLLDPAIFPNLRTVSFIVEEKVWHPLSDAPAPSPHHLPPDNPYAIFDVEDLDCMPAILRTRTKAQYDEQQWVFGYDWGALESEDEDDDRRFKWPDLQASLATRWKSRRGNQQTPSFGRVVLLGNDGPGARGPASYLEG